MGPEGIQQAVGTLSDALRGLRRFDTMEAGRLQRPDAQPRSDTQLNRDADATDIADLGRVRQLFAERGISFERVNEIVDRLAHAGDKRDFAALANRDPYLNRINNAVNGDEHGRLFFKALRGVLGNEDADVEKFLDLTGKFLDQGKDGELKRFLNSTADVAAAGGDVNEFFALAERFINADQPDARPLAAFDAFRRLGGDVRQFQHLTHEVDPRELVHTLVRARHAGMDTDALIDELAQAEDPQAVLQRLQESLGLPDVESENAAGGVELRIEEFSSREVFIQVGEQAALSLADSGAGERFTYSSEQDGELGEGRLLDLSRLAPGVHDILGKVTDAFGVSDVDRARVRVADEQGVVPERRAQDAEEFAVPQAIPAEQRVPFNRIFGNIHLELGYEQYVGIRGNGASYESYRKETLSLDFTFLSKLVDKGSEEVTNRVHELFQGDTMRDFVKSFMNLDFEDRASLDDFNTAVDKLFNELESALGLSQDALDYVQDTFKSEVSGFFERVDAARNEPLPLLTDGEGGGISFNDLAHNILRRAGELMGAAGRFEDAHALVREAAGFQPEARDTRSLLKMLNDIVNKRRTEEDALNLRDFLRSRFESEARNAAQAVEEQQPNPPADAQHRLLNGVIA